MIQILSKFDDKYNYSCVGPKRNTVNRIIGLIADSRVDPFTYANQHGYDFVTR